MRIVPKETAKEVVIEPKPALQPLPELAGHVPEGWKDTIYARS